MWSQKKKVKPAASGGSGEDLKTNDISAQKPSVDGAVGNIDAALAASEQAARAEKAEKERLEKERQAKERKRERSCCGCC